MSWRGERWAQVLILLLVSRPPGGPCLYGYEFPAPEDRALDDLQDALLQILGPRGPLCAHPLNVAASEQEGKGKVTISPRLISESLTCLASVCNFHLASQIFLLNEIGKV